MNESNKRQRITTSNNNELYINDLPDGLLVGISSYLAKPSTALFAMTMNPNNSQPTQTSRAIINSIDWSVLDFSDIEKSLVSKLSDNDIDKILKSIDAVSNVKILKLAGCVNITGSGLDMLRSSTTLEQIDMSLVGMHEVPLIEPEPLLSETETIPILDDIISRGRGSSLKQLEFPKKWKIARSIQMTQFFERYSNYLERHRHRCSKCEEACYTRGGDDWILQRTGEWHGTQSYTCTKCLNYFCDDDCKDENGDIYLKWCKKCEKGHCNSCVASFGCEGCDSGFCNECSDMTECEGGDCEMTFCEVCSGERKCHICNRMNCCIENHSCSLFDGCNNVICADCVESKGEGGWCGVCEKSFCSTECRYLEECGADATEACSVCSLAAATSFRRKLQESKKYFRRKLQESKKEIK